jgi:hypothetical protein
MNRRYVEVSATNHQWFIDKCDAEFIDAVKVLFPPAPNIIWDFLPGAEGMGGRSQFSGDPKKNGGYNLIATLMHGVTKRGIEILYKTGGKKLLTDESGAVIGILADGPEGELRIRARRGVILCCGGFHQNREMQINYLGMTFLAQGCPCGNGDGVRMTQELGARMWHMSGLSCGISYLVKDHKTPIAIGIRSSNYLYVDQRGNRFLNETGVDVHAMAFDFTATEAETMGYPRLPGYLVFDETVRSAGQMLGHCPAISWTIRLSAGARTTRPKLKRVGSKWAGLRPSSGGK